MSDLDELIRKGNELRGTVLGAPRFQLWENDVRAAVLPYGQSTMDILEGALNVSVVIMGEENFNDAVIDDVVELLESLKERSVESSRAQDAIINQKQAEARASLRTKLGSVIVNGNATFGDNSPIEQVNVGELLIGLIDEVERLPDGEEKNKIIENLRGLTTNPLFVSIASVAVGEIIKRLMGS